MLILTEYVNFNRNMLILEQITGKNEKEKLNVPRFPHLHILQSKNFKFPAFFDKIVKKGLFLLLVGIEPRSPG